MSQALAGTVTEAVDRAIAALDVDRLQQQYWEQNEFLYLNEFLPRDLVEALLVPEARTVKSDLNRNYIPGHKKGGSVSYYTVIEKAPQFLEIYRSASFRSFLNALTKAPLQLCPDNDPHSCALYYYTEPGDHIGYHYDTSYYNGARYTVLMGLLDRSAQCRLVADLFKDVPGKQVIHKEFATAPGDLVIFNGDKLWHAVTPLGQGEERIVLTMEYVTNPEMGAWKRLYSNLKDSFAYFGLRAVFKRAYAASSGSTRPR
ncbi:MAG TPA: 2OG-Fe(II) oxygenase [Nitrospiraceae bacterium]|nr:2OG-Fe(II) oxygenase [Nitrospiraceae bacterium]